MVDGTDVDEWKVAWVDYFPFLEDTHENHLWVKTLLGEDFMSQEGSREFVRLVGVPDTLIQILNDPKIVNNPNVDYSKVGGVLVKIREEFGQETLESITEETGVYLKEGAEVTSECRQPSALGSTGSLDREVSASIGGAPQGDHQGSAKGPLYPALGKIFQVGEQPARQAALARGEKPGAQATSEAEPERPSMPLSNVRLTDAEAQRLSNAVLTTPSSSMPREPTKQKKTGLKARFSDEDDAESIYGEAKELFGQGYESRQQAQEYLDRAVKLGHEEAKDVMETYHSALIIMADGKGTRSENKEAIALLQSVQDKIDVSPEIELCGKLERAKYLAYKAGKAEDPAERARLYDAARSELKGILAIEPDFTGAKLFLEKYEAEH